MKCVGLQGWEEKIVYSNGTEMWTLSCSSLLM